MRAKEIYEGGAPHKKWNFSDNVQYFYPTHLFLANISACKGDIFKEVPPREEMELFSYILDPTHLPLTSVSACKRDISREVHP